MSRLMFSFVISALTLLGCDSDPDPIDAGTDAGTVADAGAVDAGPPPMPDTSCLGTDWWAAPASATLDYNWRAADPVMAGTGIANVVGDLYALSDTGLTSPLVSDTTDPNGDGVWAGVDVGTTGIDVVAVISHPGGRHRDTYVYRNQPLSNDEGLTMFLLSNVTYGLLHSFAGATPDPAQGTVGVGVISCNGVSMAGATVSLSPMDPGTSIVYYAGGRPDVAATSSDRGGLVAIFNVPVGALTVTVMAPPSEGMAPVLWAEQEIEVRADATTLLAAWPE